MPHAGACRAHLPAKESDALLRVAVSQLQRDPNGVGDTSSNVGKALSQRVSVLLLVGSSSNRTGQLR